MLSDEFCKLFQDTYLIEHLRTAASDIDSFLEVFRKFQKIFKSTNEKMLLVYIVHTTILKGNSRK